MDFKTKAFLASLNDYIFLINRDYPLKETLKLVGDKYRLSGVQRTILFRGITTADKIMLRRSKMSTILKDRELHVDGYNVLFTIMNYMLGKPVFICNDGIVRDAGSNFGKIENQTLFNKAVEVLFDFLENSNPSSVIFYCDGPIPDSSNHKKMILGCLGQAGLEGNVNLVKSVDQKLKQLNRGIIATSDSEIIDTTRCQVLDLARLALDNKFHLNIFDLSQFD
jgi:hypothetical protein